MSQKCYRTVREQVLKNHRTVLGHLGTFFVLEQMWAGSRTFILEQCQYGSRTVPDYFAGAGNPSNIIISTNSITLISYHAGIHNFYLTLSPLF